MDYRNFNLIRDVDNPPQNPISDYTIHRCPVAGLIYKQLFQKRPRIWTHGFQQLHHRVYWSRVIRSKTVGDGLELESRIFGETGLDIACVLEEEAVVVLCVYEGNGEAW